MSDHRLTLIRMLGAIYLEQNYLDKNRTTALYREALDKIKPAMNGLVNDFGADPIGALKDLAESCLNDSAKNSHDKEDFLQKIRLSCTHDTYLYEAAAIVIKRDYTPEEAEKKANVLRDEVHEFVVSESMREITKFGYRMAHGEKDNIVASHEFVTKMISKLTDIEKGLTRSTKDHKGLVGELDFSNVDALAQGFISAISEVSPLGVLRFGWQGLNDMFGNHNGGRRGESVVVGALPSNYKSGFCLEMVKSACLYNIPYMINPLKKPLIVRFSLENSYKQDLLYLYKSLMENEFGVKIDINEDEFDAVEAAKYVYARMNSNGYEFKLLQYDPSDFGFEDLFAKILQYESEGYEIHMCNVDYVQLMCDKGIDGANKAMGQNVREKFRRIRNFMEAHAIFFLTPHQLASSARMLIRAGNEEDFVKMVARKGHWDSCTTIDQEVDMDISIHVVQYNLKKYLTVQRGKHRKFEETPLDKLFWCRLFEDIGGVKDDVLGPSLTRKKIGGGTSSGTDVDEWSVGL